MFVPVGTFTVADLLAGPVSVFDPVDGAAVVVEAAISEPVTLDTSGIPSIEFALVSDDWSDVWFAAKPSGSAMVRAIAVSGEIFLGLSRGGGSLVAPWSAATLYTTPSAWVFGDGHLFTLLSGAPGTSGPTEPDWASAFPHGTVVDGDLTWYDDGVQPASGSITFGLEVQSVAGAGFDDGYASVDELARILKIRQPTAAQTIALQRALTAAALEIDSELDLDPADALVPPFPALVVQVNLDRAEELWQQQEATLGFVGIGAETGPARIASNTWEKHAVKLAPLKGNWGIA